MWNLFTAELLRFRRWAFFAAALHLLVLAFLARVLDLAQQPLLVYRIFGAVYAAAGLLLGLYQMGGYRRANAWVNLLHRPLSNGRIALALFGAGLLWLAFAIALPILIVAGYQEAMTARVVDLRHWLLPLAAWLIAGCGYLAGGYCILGGRRYAASALVLLIPLALGHAAGLAAIALQGLVMLWLAAMVSVAFKPDLSAPPRSAPAVVTAAVPLQMGVYLLILLLGFGIEMLWIMQGSHPNNTSEPPRGGHNETERMDDKVRLLAGLAAGDVAQAPLWREQIALSDVYEVGQQISMTPVRGQLTNDDPPEFDDGRRRVRWVFSHDDMRFHGYSLADGRAVGRLGAGSASAALPAPGWPGSGWPALAEGDAVLFAGNTIYHYVSSSGQLLPRVRLPAGEPVLGAAPIGDNLGVISDRAVYFFDGRGVVEHERLLVPRQRVPIPGRSGDLSFFELIELVDGYLLSFTFTWHAHDLLGTTPYQTVLRVDDGGRVDTVARREIGYDYPALYRYKAWWPSPAMFALRQLTLRLFATPDPLRATAPPPVPRSMRWLAGTLMALSLLSAVWLTRRRALSPPARVAWIAACGLVGLPALASLWLLYPDAEQVDGLPAMRTRTA